MVGSSHCPIYNIMWVGLPVLINITGRYTKFLYRYWYFVHIIPSVIVCVLTIGIGIGHSFTKKGKKNLHYGFAGITSYFALFLLISGILIKFFQHYGKVKDKWIVLNKRIHLFSGILGTIFGIITCQIGQDLEEETELPYYIMYGFYAGLFVVLELIYKLKFLTSSSKLQQLDQNQLDTRGYRYLKEKLKEGHKLMLYEDIVFEVTKVIENAHPANPKFLAPYIGTEIGRYIYGGFGTARFTYHCHSANALKLIYKYQVGKYHNSIHHTVLSPNQKKKTEILNWEIKKKIPINSLMISPQFYNPNYQVKAILPGLDYLGKYFRVRNRN